MSLDEWITYITGLGEEKAAKVLQLYENAAKKRVSPTKPPPEKAPPENREAKEGHFEI